MDNQSMSWQDRCFHKADLTELENGVLCTPVMIVDFDGRSQPAIAVLIQLDSVKKHVMQTWPIIMSDLKVIHQAVGDDPGKDNYRELFHLYRLHQAGRKTGEIVKIINLRTLALVCLAYKKGEVPNENELEGIAFMRWTFQYLRLGDEAEMMNYINYGYDALKDEQLPWRITTGGPANAEKVRNLLDGLSRRIKEGRLTIPEDWGQRIDLSLDQVVYAAGGYAAAIEYMKRYDRTHWLNHNEWIKQWLDKIAAEKADIVSQVKALFNFPE